MAMLGDWSHKIRRRTTVKFGQIDCFTRVPCSGSSTSILSAMHCLFASSDRGWRSRSFQQHWTDTSIAQIPPSSAVVCYRSVWQMTGSSTEWMNRLLTGSRKLRHHCCIISIKCCVLYTQCRVNGSWTKGSKSPVATTRYSTQHFMEMMQQWWRSFREPFKSLFIHSDNASQHFKSSKTMNSLSRLPTLQGWQNASRDSTADVGLTPEQLAALRKELEKTTHWSFGCPGHGKILHPLVEVQHAVPPDPEACLAHETMTGLGSLGSQKKSQDPRVVLSTSGRPRGLSHYRLRCPTEELVEDTDNGVTWMPVR